MRAGKYKERMTVNVSGSAEAGFVTIRNFPGEKPVIDGRGKVPPKNEDTGLFLIADRSYVVIQGFEIRNYKAARGPRVPAGIFVIGACDHIEIRDNEIHGIKDNSNLLTHSSLV